jgi:hypothetical protein
VSESDLGTWDRKKGFWDEANSLSLRPINGIIDDPITGPQAGHVVIDGRVKAFFVPAKDGFTAYKDENEPVHFFVGFSPIGLRAWEVRKGHIPNGDRIQLGAPVPQPTTVLIAHPAVSEETKVQRIRDLKVTRVMTFIRDLVAAKQELGAELTLDEIISYIEATFGIDNIMAVLGYDDLRVILEQSGLYDLSDAGEDVLVKLKSGVITNLGVARKKRSARLYGQIVFTDLKKKFGFIIDNDDKKYWFNPDSLSPDQKPKLRSKGQIVEFIPETNQYGLLAIGITILSDDVTLSKDGLVEPDRLRGVVKAATVNLLNESEQKLSFRDLSGRLLKQFRGAVPLNSRLKLTSLRPIIEEIDGIHTYYDSPDSFIELKETRAFGRLPSSSPKQQDLAAKPKNRNSKKPANLKGEGPDTSTTKPVSNKSAQRATEIVLQFLKGAQSEGRKVKLGHVATELGKEFPGLGQLAKRLGFENLVAFLHSIPSVETYGEPNDLYVRTKATTKQPPGRALEAKESKPKDKNYGLKEVREKSIELVRSFTEEGKEMSATRLASELSSLFTGEGKLMTRIGHKTFSKFIESMPELEIYGEGPNRLIRLRP